MKPRIHLHCLLGMMAIAVPASGSARAGDGAAETYLPPTALTPYGEAPNAREHRVGGSGGEETYSLILYDGDEALTAITEFAKRHSVVGAHFTAIGAVHDVKVGWFDRDRKQYKIIPVDGQVEMLSLVGDIGVVNGKPVVHAHAVLGLPDGSTRGGHLIHAIASPTLEVFITTGKTILNKAPDEASGITLFK